MHGSALVAALMSNNDGNRRDICSGAMLKRGVCLVDRVEIPTNPDLTKFKRRCDTATWFLEPIGTLLIGWMTPKRLRRVLSDWSQKYSHKSIGQKTGLCVSA